MQENRICQNCNNSFSIEPEDFDFYKKMDVPPPTFCPECRMIRRFSYRNESSLFRRKDGHSGKEIFSGFSPDSPVVTYENNFWYGDAWDPFATGRDYDFSRPFFEQFRELLTVAPLPARSVILLTNSDYCNEAGATKNSYLCFNVDYLENCAYIRKSNFVKESLDCFEVTECELCYEDVYVDKSYQTFFSFDCENCVEVWFSQGLRGCTHCFGCVNLRKKNYYFFNEQCTRESYEEKLARYNLTSHQELKALRKHVNEFWKKFPVKYNHTLRTLNSTGERIFDSKNVQNSYSIKEGENLRFCQDIIPKASNSYDYSVWGMGAENIYESMTCGRGIYNIRFCFNCWENARDMDYSVYCMGSHDLFGCVGLYKKEYSILNKQYQKEEYFTLREKIVQHMKDVPYTDATGRIFRYGEFFPFEISPIGYNESLMQDFFPLTKDEAKAKGYVWFEPSVREYQTTVKAKDLPDVLDTGSDTIIKEIIECEECARAYRIIPSEFEFYEKFKIALPRLCHNCRFKERFRLVNPPKLWHRSCMCENEDHAHPGRCLTDFETSYAPERPEKVYCEACYQEEII